MMQQKFLHGPCSQCGQTIRYPAHLVGTVGTCPMCRQQTEFVLETPPHQPSIERRALIWTVIAILVLVFGLAAAMIALKRARDLHKPNAPARQTGSLQWPERSTTAQLT